LRNRLRLSTLRPAESKLTTVDLSATRELAQLPAGALGFAAGARWRREEMDSQASTAGLPRAVAARDHEFDFAQLRQRGRSARSDLADPGARHHQPDDRQPRPVAGAFDQCQLRHRAGPEQPHQPGPGFLPHPYRGRDRHRIGRQHHRQRSDGARQECATPGAAS